MEALPDLQEFKGVKALVEKGLNRLPRRFIRPLEERIQMSCDFDDEIDQIPLIDLQEYLNSSGHSPRVLEEIRRACREWGCFQVVNHGVSPSTMTKMMEVAREFFALPEEEKMQYFTLDASATVRYSSSFNLLKDKVLNWRDFIRYSCHPLEEVVHLWPPNPPGFREATLKYCTQMHGVVKTLCRAISQSLGLPQYYIDEEFRDYSQVMVCNYYPPCPEPESTLGCGSHTDSGWITVLMQDDVGGLQVLHEDRWVAAKPTPNALVVNVGDVLRIISNGKYKSAEHRAIVNASRDRVSVATTYGPSLNAVIRPAPDLLVDASDAVYGETVYKNYINGILNAPLEDKRSVDYHRLEILKKNEI